MNAGKMSPEAGSDPSSLVGIAVANAFALTVAVYISIGVSGGHVNPAVTFARAVGRHISLSMALFYWISQLLGSVMACVLLKVFTVQQVFKESNRLSSCDLIVVFFRFSIIIALLCAACTSSWDSARNDGLRRGHIGGRDDICSGVHSLRGG